MQTTFSERLSDAVSASPMTQGQIAAAAGVAGELLSRWKKLDRAPRSSVLPAIAAALEVNAQWLATGDGERAAGGASGAPTRAEFEALRARVAELEAALAGRPATTTTKAAAAAARAARASGSAGEARERSQPRRSSRPA